MNATDTHDDRMVVGGAVPGTGQLDLPAYADVLGTESHLERRELGIINLGGAGHVVVDGEKLELEHFRRHRDRRRVGVWNTFPPHLHARRTDVALCNLGPGTYSGDVVLPTGGTWEAQVSLRTTEFDNPVRTLRFAVP